VDRPDRELRLGLQIVQLEGRHVVEGSTRGDGEHELCPIAPGRLAPTRDVVVVEMRFKDEGDTYPGGVSEGDESVHVALRIDEDAYALMGEQVGGVAKTGGAKRLDVHGASMYRAV
jgi:hypothetical protein